MKTYLELKDEKSEKFWEADLAEGSCEVNVRYGKITSKGTQSSKSFNTPDQAQAYYDKQIKAKLKKGYQLAGTEVSTANATPAKETSSMITEYLCSPSEKSQKLGLELINTLLDTNPELIDIPALVLVAYVNIEDEPSDYSEIRTEALRLLNKLPNKPKDLGDEYSMRFIKYICENATSDVIFRMIQLSSKNSWDRFRDNQIHWNDTQLRSLPNELGLFPDLTEVNVWGAYLTEFPQVLLKLKKLKSINLYASKISELPAEIGSLKHLECIDIGHNLTELPNEISQLKNLANLGLCNNKLTQLPNEINQLKNLVHLNLLNNKLAQLPESLAELINLESIHLDGNPMTAPVQVTKMFEGFHENGVDVETRKIHINLIFERHQRACELADTHTIIRALNANLALLRSNAILALGMKVEQAYQASSLTKQSHVVVIGKFGFTTTEIKDRLKEHGVTVTNAIKKETTHVLVGEKPGKKAEHISSFDGILMTETHLTAFLQAEEAPVFLDESHDTTGAQENISELLLSDDEGNQVLALEMLKRAGVPSKLITPLFFMFKLTKNKKVRDTAKVLLLQGASSAFTQIINKRQNFKTATNAEIADTFMEELSECKELDIDLFSKLYCQKKRLGLNHFFTHGTDDDIVEMLNDMVDDQGVLDLQRNCLGFLPEAIGDVQGIKTLNIYDNKLTTLPASLSKLETLTHLKASYNHFKTIPKELSNCTKLTSLDLEGNAIKKYYNVLKRLPELKNLNFGWEKMKTIPTEIMEISQLEELNLYTSSATAFPVEISNLKKLSKLDLSSCGLQTLPGVLFELTQLIELKLSSNDLNELPEDLAKLTNLEALNLRFNKFKIFPKVITQLSNLRHLNLQWCGPHDLPEEIANLKKLETLEITIEMTTSQQNKLKAIMPSSCVITF